MFNWKHIVLALLVALLLFSLGAGAGYGAHWYLTKNTPNTEEAQEFGVYWEAWHIVEDRYYGGIPDGPAAVYGAIHGALGTLEDPYTLFVEPQPRALEKAELEGQFGGIGAFVSRGPEGEVILAPMVDSPAEQAGVQEGDIVIQVDDAPITPEMTTDEVILLIRGEVDTQVTIALERDLVVRSTEATKQKRYYRHAAQWLESNSATPTPTSRMPRAIKKRGKVVTRARSRAAMDLSRPTKSGTTM